MERKERFKSAVDYLKNNGLVHKQKDVAEKMGSTEPNISAALRGVGTVLTDKFLYRFNRAFGSIFEDNWLKKGEGQMLKATQTVGDINNSNVSGVNVNGNGIQINPNAYDTLLKIVENNQRSTEKFQEQIDRLLSIIEIKYNIK